MDEHQRRLWTRMIESVDAFRADQIDLRTLVSNLGGFLRAADLRSEVVVGEFYNHLAPIDMELELRNEVWAPEGSADDRGLDSALGDFRSWASGVLGSTDDERT